MFRIKRIIWSESKSHGLKQKTNYIKEYNEDLIKAQKSENLIIKAKIVDKSLPKNMEIMAKSNHSFCYYKNYILRIQWYEFYWMWY